MTSSAARGSRFPVGSSARSRSGLVHERAGDGHALLLAAGELRRAVVDAIGQADRLERRSREAVVPVAVGVEQRQLDVLERARPRQEVEGLEHEADPLVPEPGLRPHGPARATSSPSSR